MDMNMYLKEVGKGYRKKKSSNTASFGGSSEFVGKFFQGKKHTINAVLRRCMTFTTKIVKKYLFSRTTPRRKKLLGFE